MIVKWKAGVDPLDCLPFATFNENVNKRLPSQFELFAEIFNIREWEVRIK